jgi:hypothetical protein
VFLGRYDEALRSFAEARKTLRAGEPEYFLSHATAWAAYASMLCGRWDETLVLGDVLVAMREEAQSNMGRFTFPDGLPPMRVAAARLDTTRLARYRSAFVAIGAPELLPDSLASLGRRSSTATRRPPAPLPLDARQP